MIPNKIGVYIMIFYALSEISILYWDSFFYRNNYSDSQNSAFTEYMQRSLHPTVHWIKLRFVLNNDGFVWYWNGNGNGLIEKGRTNGMNTH